MDQFTLRDEKVRLEGKVFDCAVSFIVGVEATGCCRVLGCDIAIS